MANKRRRGDSSGAVFAFFITLTILFSAYGGWAAREKFGAARVVTVQVERRVEVAGPAVVVVRYVKATLDRVRRAEGIDSRLVCHTEPKTGVDEK